jgi:hypothetical protein
MSKCTNLKRTRILRLVQECPGLTSEGIMSLTDYTFVHDATRLLRDEGLIEAVDDHGPTGSRRYAWFPTKSGKAEDTSWLTRV